MEGPQTPYEKAIDNSFSESFFVEAWTDYYVKSLQELLPATPMYTPSYEKHHTFRISQAQREEIDRLVELHANHLVQPYGISAASINENLMNLKKMGFERVDVHTGPASQSKESGGNAIMPSEIGDDDMAEYYMDLAVQQPDSAAADEKAEERKWMEFEAWFKSNSSELKRLWLAKK